MKNEPLSYVEDELFEALYAEIKIRLLWENNQ